MATATNIVKRGKVYFAEHDSGAWVGCDSHDSAVVVRDLWHERDNLRTALEAILNDGGYDDDGDFILYHAPAKSEDDDTTPPAIANAAQLLLDLDRVGMRSGVSFRS